VQYRLSVTLANVGPSATPTTGSHVMPEITSQCAGGVEIHNVCCLAANPVHQVRIVCRYRRLAADRAAPVFNWKSGRLKASSISKA
jgi:hypothetical protein